MGQHAGEPQQKVQSVPFEAFDDDKLEFAVHAMQCVMKMSFYHECLHAGCITWSKDDEKCRYVPGTLVKTTRQMIDIKLARKECITGQLLSGLRTLCRGFLLCSTSLFLPLTGSMTCARIRRCASSSRLGARLLYNYMLCVNYFVQWLQTLHPWPGRWLCGTRAPGLLACGQCARVHRRRHRAWKRPLQQHLQTGGGRRLFVEAFPALQCLQRLSGGGRPTA